MAAEYRGFDGAMSEFRPIVEMEFDVHQRIRPLTAGEQQQIGNEQVWIRTAIWDERDGQMSLSRNTTAWGKDYWELRCKDGDGFVGIRQHPFSATTLQVCWASARKWEDVAMTEFAEFKEVFDTAIGRMPENPKIEDEVVPLPESNDV